MIASGSPYSEGSSQTPFALFKAQPLSHWPFGSVCGNQIATFNGSIGGVDLPAIALKLNPRHFSAVSHLCALFLRLLHQEVVENVSPYHPYRVSRIQRYFHWIAHFPGVA